ncbi:lactonase family protein [Bacillus sp. OAE603]|uniref:lactonase family protein n=1 Tax=Gottfriedia sp. OAE603 TaxID=2663872 RepID=UPI001789FB27
MQTTNSKFLGYIGTYTKGESKGIYRFTLDTNAERIIDVAPAATLENPTYVTISKDNKNLYSVVKEGDKGGVTAFSIHEDSGDLVKINSQFSEGASPCHVSVNEENHVVVTANYHKGTIESFEVNGQVNPVTSTMQHIGTGPNQSRQEKPHAHYSGFSPDEKFVLAVDLGTDEINTYKLDNSTLTKSSSLNVKPGSGPRHLTFHPNGQYAYVMTELSSEVIVLSYNKEDGSFTELQYISTIPADFTENNQGSAIHISNDGHFVYAGNRGHNSIAVFSVNQDNGKLELVEIVSSEGNWPRDFVLDPTENYVIASNEISGNLVLFARDHHTGKLTVIHSDVLVPEPVCVKFLHVTK